MSWLHLINRTNEQVRLAVFQRPVHDPTSPTIAWLIADAPPGRPAPIKIPAEFGLLVRYSHDSSHPMRLDAEEGPVWFHETATRFAIKTGMSWGSRATSLLIDHIHTDAALNQLQVENHHSIPVQITVLRGKHELLAPRFVAPGGQFAEDISPRLYVAVVASFTQLGHRLVEEEISLTQTEVREGSMLALAGSMWAGYTLTAA